MEIVKRSDALQAGATRYFTGKHCRHGHVSERITLSGECCACSILKTNRWRENNPEQLAAIKKDWARRNPGKTNASWKRCYWKNQSLRDRHALHVKAWTNANRGKKNAAEAKRRAATVSSTPAWADLRAIKLVYQEAALQRRAGINVHVDHVLPLQGKNICGLHVHTNLQIISARANRIKTNLLVGENHGI